MLFLSFALYQAAIMFALGCHVLAARAAWRQIGKWGKLLTMASGSLWLTVLLRLLSQFEVIAENPAITYSRTPALEELFFWSAVSFPCALMVGYALRQTMLALTGEGLQAE